MKSIFLFISVLISRNTWSQVAIKNASLVKPDTNALVYWSENVLTVSGTSAKVNLISSVGNTIIATGNNQFSVHPRTLKTDTLSVFAGKNLLLKKAFFFDTTFSIKIHVGNISNDTATVNEILANKGLKVVVNSLHNSPPLRIIGFYTTFTGPSQDTLARHVPAEGNLFTIEQQTIIKRLARNSKIIFDYVVLRAPDSRDRAVGPYFIFVK
jgi:hypothetical protein